MRGTSVILTDEERIQIGRQFGKRLHELICKRFSSERGFSMVTGIKERLLFKLRKGENPTLQTIFLLAKALDVHPKKLFEFDTKEKIMPREKRGHKTSHLGQKDDKIAELRL